MLFDPNAIMKSYITDTAPLEDIFYVKGKVAIVTGGTSGLGFCTAQRLLQGGAWSFAHIYDLPEEEFVKTLNINLVGAYRCAKHVSKYMVEHGVKGKIVLVSSNVAYLPQPVFGGYAHYAASKGGVISMTTEIAKELKRYGIMVNSVAPGGMWTPGCLSNGPVKSLSPEKQAEIGKEMMVAKLDATPSADSVAVVVYAMCTRMADGITGETVVADSGMMRNIVSYQPAIEEYRG